jgi:ferredoxin-NADP reductase
MFAVLERIETNNPRVVTFWFQPEKPLHFVAGQFTELFLPHPNTDDRGDKRWFTISSSPTETMFSITTKFPTKGVRTSSFKQALRQLSIGTRLHFAEPMGDFVLPKDQQLPIVFVAAGIGITPVHSMISYLSKSGEQRDLTVLYATSYQEDLVFADVIQKYAKYYRLFARQAKGGNRLSAADILEAATRYSTDVTKDPPLIYLSGPEQMVALLSKQLQAAGVPAHSVIVDFFHGYREM